MEILMKVITFCGCSVFFVAIATLTTKFLMKHYPRIIKKLLGD
jgi:hypothetical protein